MEKIVIGNMKMNILSLPERERYLQSLKQSLSEAKISDTVSVVLCPPFVHIESFAKSLKSKKIGIGAQNMFVQEKGSYTGEISPLMLKNIGATSVIVGHSERRKFFQENNQIANIKLKVALKYDLMPVYCIGETREERDSGSIKRVLKQQLEEGLEGIVGKKAESILLVYEPIWAVGTDQIPTSNEIMEVRILIKKILIEMYSIKTAESVRVLYGGSVKAKLVNAVCLEPGMDGVLVGRESLLPREFIKIAKLISNA